MKNGKIISTIRRNYGGQTLNEAHLKANPLEQFKVWFEAMLVYSQQFSFQQGANERVEGGTHKNSNAKSTGVEYDPTAMVLSTVDAQGFPDSRVLLLKELEDDGFVFYTNYESTKAIQLKNNPHAALNFYWPSLAQQVRVRGVVKQLSKARSAAYFASRPRASQLSAIASPQSQEIASREALLEIVQLERDKHNQQLITCPNNWGGYVLIPEEIEFWQGRDDRLHDRIQYYKQHGQWQYRRLAP